MGIQLRGGNELIDPVQLLFRGGIAQGQTVADLGCGTAGHFVFPAAHFVGEQGKVYAVDILKSVLQSIESRKKLEGVDNVETVWADLERPLGVSIPAESVDLTMLLNTLFQIGNKAAVLKEAARLTKPGGTLLVADWKMTKIPFGPVVEKRIDQTAFKQLAAEAGFECMQEFDAGPYHWGMRLRKKS